MSEHLLEDALEFSPHDCLMIENLERAVELLTELRRGKSIVCGSNERELMDILEHYMEAKGISLDSLKKRVEYLSRLKSKMEEGFSEEELLEMMKEDVPKYEATELEQPTSKEEAEEEFGPHLSEDLPAFGQTKMSQRIRTKMPPPKEHYPRYRKRT